MKKLIRLLALSLSLVILIGITPIMPVYASETAVSGSCGTNLTWSLDETGTMTISGTGAMTDFAAGSDVPWESLRDDITSVVVEDGVTNVGDYAFYY